MSNFDQLVTEKTDTNERHKVASEFFLSLKEKTAKKGDKSLRQIARDETRKHLAKGGVSTTKLSPKTRLKSLKIDTVVDSVKKVKRLTSSELPKPSKLKIKGPSKDLLKKKLKLKYAAKGEKELLKQAMIERLIRGLVEGAAKGGAKVKGLWGAHKEGLSGVMHGATTPRPGKWERLKAWIMRRKTPVESSALGKGPKFHEGWLKGQELNRVAGVTDSQKIFWNTVRDKSGKVTPSSMYKGLENLGILTPEAIMGLGSRARGAVKEISAARAAEKIRRRNMMLGAGALGVGTVALLKKKKAQKRQPLEV